MAKSRLAALGFTIALALAGPAFQGSVAAEFSAEVRALPFPPDARELEFVAWTGDIKFVSQSPLKSLAAFYLKEMASRGWEHDESAAVVEGETIKLRFKHDAAVVQLELRQRSKEVQVGLDCEKLKFSGIDDPAKLAQAGIPVSRAALFVQKELPLPADTVNLQFSGDGCTFKSSTSLAESFEHFMRMVPGKGFRESRRPIVTESRRYTEFKKGSAQLSVNVFSDPIGSRIILTYKDDAKEATVQPLAAVASLPIRGGGAGNAAPSETTVTPAGATPIDVTSNKGSATVSYAGKQYTFPHVACFRTKSRGSQATMAVFSAKPIPLHKMQSLISTQDDFSFGDLYEFSAPDRLVLQLGEHLSFAFSLPSVGISHSVDNPVNEIKVEADRVRGMLKMPPKEIFKGEQFSFTATVDSTIITPTTRIAGPGDPVVRSDNALLTDSPVPFPDGIENAGREGSKFRKTYRALVRKPLAEVEAFYRRELAAKGWGLPASGSSEAMRFKNGAMELSVALKQQGAKTEIEVVTRDTALARREGILPEPGKGRVILGNANNVPVVFTIGNANYSLKAGQGAKDYQQAVKQSLAPGTYTAVVKVQGQAPQSETIELAEGATWGIIALPRAGCLPVQLY
jgi:hypothetical protein